MKRLDDASTLSDEQLVERWKTWLAETQREAFHLYSFRFLFENITRMFASNSALVSRGSFVYDWLLRIFSADHLISIRRELETGGGHLTLANFLAEISRHSERVLTRRRYTGLYSEEFRRLGMADEDFNGLRGAMCHYPRRAEAEDCISGESVASALRQLQNETKRVVFYANWYVAHRTRQKPMQLTVGEMFKTVNRIFDTYATYYLAVAGRSWVSRYPERQYDWTAPFAIAWITEDFRAWDPPREP